MRRLLTILAVTSLALSVSAFAGRTAAAQTPAKELFGAMAEPAPLAARAIGSYAKGCLAGGVALPINGPAWQVMRLSRNRNWGHPKLVGLLERIAVGAQSEGWPGLLVGDLAQPRGGPMTSGHASHQIGLDADIWLTPMPNRTLIPEERETISAVSMLKDGTRQVDPARWSDAHARLIRLAARQPEVDRIFVHPGIKQELCRTAGNDRAWLRKVRPWWGHHYHFHVRIDCPGGSAGCTPQGAPPAGDGCGEELAWWLSDEPWTPSDTPAKPKPPLTLTDLPRECRMVLDARGAPVFGVHPAPPPNPLRRSG
ncbi:penicillin-insensitive murein endopeptidase [Lutibaculum baratangense]|nr:penicillin-insensitive murein endopeptidase [Lutibaculum baratangense]